jgi:hypothetical protein
MSAIVGPIAPYSNPPIQPQFYNPSRFVILDIDLGQQTTVTIDGTVDYFVGQEVRLLIPESNGSWQLSNQTGIVLEIPTSDSVILSINSALNVDPFIAGTGVNSPQIIPVGDYNSGKINSSGRINLATSIPGSFINVS